MRIAAQFGSRLCAPKTACFGLKPTQFSPHFRNVGILALCSSSIVICVRVFSSRLLKNCSSCAGHIHLECGGSDAALDSSVSRGRQSKAASRCACRRTPNVFFSSLLGSATHSKPLTVDLQGANDQEKLEIVRGERNQTSESIEIKCLSRTYQFRCGYPNAARSVVISSRIAGSSIVGGMR